MNGARWVKTGAVLGFLAVSAGAFGAHYLRERLHLEPRQLETFETGVRYQMYHAIAIVVVGILRLQGPRTRCLTVSSWAFLVGVLLFSGSLYALSLNIGPRQLLGPMTPLGGVAFLVGWAALAIGVSTRTHGPGPTEMSRQETG